MDGTVLATLLGLGLGVLACGIAFIACRIWRRNRYYKKVQHSLDEEERAFQETLSRSYQNDEETGLDGGDKEKLQMLETYMQSLEQGGEAMPPSDEAPLPSRAEDVDKFMAELAAAASGSTPGERGASGGDGVELQRAEEGD